MQMTLNSFFNDIPPHETPLQASSSPIPTSCYWEATTIVLRLASPKNRNGLRREL